MIFFVYFNIKYENGRDNFLITPIYTHTGTKEEILKKHNCLDVSSMPNANFMKQSHIYSKLKDKRYHTNDNFKPRVLHYSNFSIDVNQIREIENFI